MEEEIIFPEDDRAAKPAKLMVDDKEVAVVWISRDGFIHKGEHAEEAARNWGATHLHCEQCGGAARKYNRYCVSCAEEQARTAYRERAKEKWDGTSLIYSEKFNRYYVDPFHAFEDAEEREVAVEDLRLFTCKPVFCDVIDPEDHYIDILPDEGDVDDIPEEILTAFEMLNAVIRECKTPVTYYPTEKALDLDQFPR